jgi:hypothetical protein
LLGPPNIACQQKLACSSSISKLEWLGGRGQAHVLLY